MIADSSSLGPRIRDATPGGGAFIKVLGEK
jgi:hypothetical protein